MLLKTKVKVGNVTNLSDARYCAGMGVDLLGFPIGNGDGQIAFEVFHEISEWVAGPEFVLEYTDTIDDDQFKKVTQSAAIQHIQVTYEQLEHLKSTITKQSIILSIDISKWPLVQQELLSLPISYLIITSQQDINWRQLEKINAITPVLVPHHYLADQDISRLPLSGIVLEGTAEDKPGQKDYDHLSEVLESLEVA